MASFRTPLGRARGLGSAQHGVGHFIGQRVSALALIFLMLWGVWSAFRLAGGSYATAILWLHSPLNAALLALLSATAFYHMQLGMRTIIEDYIHKPATKVTLLIASLFACYGGAALTIVCLLKIAIGGVS